MKIEFGNNTGFGFHISATIFHERKFSRFGFYTLRFEFSRSEITHAVSCAFVVVYKL